VLHNTQIPTFDEWHRISGERRMAGLATYYRDERHWSAGPHLFVADDLIWAFTPLNVPGVHSPSWNGVSWGVELVGDYDREPFGDDVKRNGMEAMAALHRLAGWSGAPHPAAPRGPADGPPLPRRQRAERGDGGGRADLARSRQMIVPRWVVPAVLLVVGLVGATLSYQHFANRGPSPTVRDSVVVLTASKRPDSVAHAALVVAATTAQRESRTAEAHARVHKSRADTAAAAAVASTTAQDSAEHWRVAYLEEKHRADSLDVALAAERRATLFAQRADSASQSRLARVERLNADMAKEAGRLSGGCHLLPFLRCPTRKETAVVAAAATYLVLRR
jgi:hypothetical protein